MALPSGEGAGSFWQAKGHSCRPESDRFWKCFGILAGRFLSRGLFRYVTADAELISIGIAKIGTVEIGVVVRANVRLPCVSSTQLKRQNVASIDRGASVGHQSDHLTISGSSFLTVEWPSHNKQGPVAN